MTKQLGGVGSHVQSGAEFAGQIRDGVAARQDTTALDRSRQAPTSRWPGRKAKKSFVIFWIANKHERPVHPISGRGVECPTHQSASDPALLASGIDRDGADHDERESRSIIGVKVDGPALDTAHEPDLVNRSEAERRQRLRVTAHLIGGARVPVGAEGTVEQALDSGGIDLG